MLIASWVLRSVVFVFVGWLVGWLVRCFVSSLIFSRADLQNCYWLGNNVPPIGNVIWRIECSRNRWPWKLKGQCRDSRVQTSNNCEPDEEKQLTPAIIINLQLTRIFRHYRLFIGKSTTQYRGMPTFMLYNLKEHIRYSRNSINTREIVTMISYIT